MAASARFFRARVIEFAAIQGEPSMELNDQPKRARKRMPRWVWIAIVVLAALFALGFIYFLAFIYFAIHGYNG
jgi:hypothetical protein